MATKERCKEIIATEMKVIQAYLVHYGKLYKMYKDLEETIEGLTDDEASKLIIRRGDMLIAEDSRLGEELKKIGASLSSSPL